MGIGDRHEMKVAIASAAVETEEGYDRTANTAPTSMRRR
jgi:hypothetical protein